MARKTAKQREDVFRVAVRPVYSRSAQMPTISSYIGILESLYGRDVQFKRDTRVLALQAALKYADARGINVENRAIVETRLQRLQQEQGK